MKHSNEDDDDGRSEASILIMTKNGEGLGFYESEIQSIESGVKYGTFGTNRNPCAISQYNHMKKPRSQERGFFNEAHLAVHEK